MSKEVSANKLNAVIDLANQLKAMQAEYQPPGIMESVGDWVKPAVGAGALVLSSATPASAHELDRPNVVPVSVKASGSDMVTQTVGRTPNFYRFGVVSRMQAHNKSTAANDTPPADTPQSQTYKLQKGETVWHVVDQHAVAMCGRAVTSKEFIDSNDIKDARRLPVGYPVKCPDDSPVLETPTAQVPVRQTGNKYPEAEPTAPKRISPIAALRSVLSAVRKPVAVTDRIPVPPDSPVVPPEPGIADIPSVTPLTTSPRRAPATSNTAATLARAPSLNERAEATPIAPVQAPASRPVPAPARSATPPAASVSVPAPDRRETLPSAVSVSIQTPGSGGSRIAVEASIPAEDKKLAESLIKMDTVRKESNGITTIEVGDGFRVNIEIADQTDRLLRAAYADGINLRPRDSFRTAQDQADRRRTNGCSDDHSSSRAAGCVIPTAPVGESNHEIGKAIDFGLVVLENGQPVIEDGKPKLRSINRSDEAFKWLQRRAGEFGFKNLPSEAWHWSPYGN